MKSNSIKYSILILLFLPALLIAQENANDDNTKTVRMIYFGASKTAPKELTVLQEGDTIPLDFRLPRNNFSKSLKVDGGSKGFIIAPKGTEKDEEGNWKKYPQIQIPTGWKKILIFLKEDEKNNLFPIKGNAFNAGDDKFAPGEMLIVNLSNYGLIGTVGDQQVKVSPKKELIVDQILEAPGNFNIILDYVDLKEQQKHQFIRRSAVWVGRFRHLIFIFDVKDKPYPSFATSTIRAL